MALGIVAGTTLLTLAKVLGVRCPYTKTRVNTPDPNFGRATAAGGNVI